ncbi:MAG TPA: hypothetical protein PK392_12260, partial [Opitutaceae bacterium]|nr:hypothetical protein [Opitutaceae bacterium]
MQPLGVSLIAHDRHSIANLPPNSIVGLTILLSAWGGRYQLRLAGAGGAGFLAAFYEQSCRHRQR